MRAIAIVFFLALSVLAQTSRWEYQGTYRHQKIYFRDFKTERDIVTVTVKKGTKSAAGHLRINCTEQSIKYLAWPAFVAIKPHTFGEWIFNKACY